MAFVVNAYFPIVTDLRCGRYIAKYAVASLLKRGLGGTRPMSRTSLATNIPNSHATAMPFTVKWAALNHLNMRTATPAGLKECIGLTLGC